MVELEICGGVDGVELGSCVVVELEVCDGWEGYVMCYWKVVILKGIVFFYYF